MKGVWVRLTDAGVEFQVEVYSSGGASTRRSWQLALQKSTVQEPETHSWPHLKAQPLESLPERVSLATTMLYKEPEKFFGDETKRAFYKNSLRLFNS